jgi:hypothetical protein
VLCFSRDEWVRKNCLYQVHRPLLGLDAQPSLQHSPHFGTLFNETTCAPPSGVQPFAGLATYFGPLCYIYRDIASCYSVCRSMYAQLWCKMNVISEDVGTLVYVCKTFENLLLANHPKLVLHLNNIGVQPLQVRFSGFCVFLMDTSFILVHLVRSRCHGCN